MKKRVRIEVLLLVLLVLPVVAAFPHQDNSSSQSTSEWLMSGRTFNGTSYTPDVGIADISTAKVNNVTFPSVQNPAPTLRNGSLYVTWGNADPAGVIQLNASNISQQLYNFSSTDSSHQTGGLAGPYYYFGDGDSFYQLNASNVSHQIANFTNGLSGFRGDTLVVNGYVYVGGNDDRLYQLNASNVTHHIYNASLTGDSYSAATYQDPYVYVTDRSGRLFQLNASNITHELYRFTGLEDAWYGIPVIYDDSIYAGGDSNKLFRLNSSNVSQTLGNFTTGGDIKSGPAAAHGFIYVGSYDQRLYQLNATNVSQQIANVSINGNPGRGPVITDEYVYIGSSDNKLYQFDAFNVSKQIANFTTNSDVEGIVVAEGMIYFGTVGTTFYSLGDGSPESVLHTPADETTLGAGSISVNFNCTGLDGQELLNISLYITNSSNLSFSLNQTLSINGTRNNTNWTLDLLSGDYTWNCLTFDSASTFDWGKNRSLIQDVSVPIVTIVLPENNSNTSNPQENVNFTISETPNTCWYANDSMTVNTTLSSCANITTVTWSEGNHNVTVYVNDSAGNENSTSVTFTLDSGTPTIDIVTPTNLTNTTNTGLNVTFTTNDLTGFCWYANDTMSINTTLANCANITTVTWSQGRHNVTVFVNDSAGNENDTSVSFIIDSEAPLLSISSPGNHSNTSDTGLNISFTTSDELVVSCSYANDSMTVNNSLANCANITTVTWSEGNHNVTIFANDTVGNTNSTSVSFTIDSQAPQISIGLPGNNTNSSNTGLHVNFSVSELDGFCWYANDTMSINTTLANCANITTVTWAEGQHNISVFVNDSAGNENDTSVSFTIDTTPPVLSITTPANNTNTSDTALNISFTSDDYTGYCWYANDSLSINTTLASCANVTSVTWTEGQHNLTVFANDSAGNENDTSVLFTIDTSLPAVTLISPANESGATDGNVTFNYNVSDNVGVDNCSLILNDVLNITNTTISLNVVQNFSLTNLSIGRYNWSVNCSDKAGTANISEERFVSTIENSNFSGLTTDLTAVNVSNITNLIIDEPSHGFINYTAQINLEEGADLDQFVSIASNRIEVNSTALVALNNSARLTLYNLTYTTPQILRDGDTCGGGCSKVSYSSGTLLFTVTDFSVYSARETPAAEDTSDSSSSTGGGGGGSAGTSTCGDGLCDTPETCSWTRTKNENYGACFQDCGYCNADSVSSVEDIPEEADAEIREKVTAEILGGDEGAEEKTEGNLVGAAIQNSGIVGSDLSTIWITFVVMGLLALTAHLTLFPKSKLHRKRKMWQRKVRKRFS